MGDKHGHRMFYFQNLKFTGGIGSFVGDVRDIQSIKNAMNEVDYIFHTVALKYKR
jgi:FlaA1/EpsC-like NDP-sugar epimerase